jgi:hypothetical protein
MNYAFEKEKNLKASVITAVITIILFSIFFYVRYTQPKIPEPTIGEGIEVNLGNSETGLGNIAPLAPGEAAPETRATNTPTPNTSNTPISATDNANDDDVAVNKTVRENKKTSSTTTIEKPIPAPKPKALFTGTKPGGTGGNNADSYNKSTNQGIAGGKGDQGNPNGNPNSDSYTGNSASGNSGSGNGVSIRNGLDGRRITKLPAFEDDFNENAKVAVDITVDKAGTVTAATINPRGTTTTNSNIRTIALRKARSLKLNGGSTDEQTGTLVFSFRLRN